MGTSITCFALTRDGGKQVAYPSLHAEWMAHWCHSNKVPPRNTTFTTLSIILCLNFMTRLSYESFFAWVSSVSCKKNSMRRQWRRCFVVSCQSSFQRGFWIRIPRLGALTHSDPRNETRDRKGRDCIFKMLSYCHKEGLSRILEGSLCF